MNLLLERYKWKSSEGDFYIDAFFSNFIWFFTIKEIYNRGENLYLLKRNYKGTKHNMQLKIKLSTRVVTFDMFYMYTSSWTI